MLCTRCLWYLHSTTEAILDKLTKSSKNYKFKDKTAFNFKFESQQYFLQTSFCCFPSWCQYHWRPLYSYGARRKQMVAPQWWTYWSSNLEWPRNSKDAYLLFYLKQLWDDAYILRILSSTGKPLVSSYCYLYLQTIYYNIS